MASGPEVPGGASPPAGPQPPGPQPPAPTSRLAIASLVTGVLALVPLAIGFGIAALRRIPRRGQSGRPLAIVGLLLSALWMVGLVTILLIAALAGTDRDADGRLTEPASISVFDVQVGDCLESVEPDAETTSLDGVPCADRHVGEAISRFSLPEGAYPGDEAVFAAGDERCGQVLREQVRPAERDGVEPFYLFPTETSWEAQDDREIVCIVLSSQPRTGAVTR